MMTLVTMPFIVTDLPDPVAPAMSRCGIVARLMSTGLPAMSTPSPTVSGWCAAAASGERSTSPSVMRSRSRLGTSMPMADLPGIGATMRISGVASA
jgi:hypothetical protein